MEVFRRREGFLFVGFILSQPVIDISTGILTRYVNSVVTPGALIRTLLLFFIVPYIWEKLAHRRVMKVLFVSAIGAIVCTSVISLVSKQPFFFSQEAAFYMKTLYYIAGVFFISLYVHDQVLHQTDAIRAIRTMGFLIGGSYFLALVTQTSFPSYPHDEMGFSGWFFSANELSVIVILSFAAMLTIIRQQPRFMPYVTLFLLAGMGVLIGTKSAYIGIAIVLMIGLIELLWTYRLKLFRIHHTVAVIVLTLLFVSALPFAPMTKNRAHHMEQIHTDGGLFVQRVNDTKTVPMNNILSSRQQYVTEMATDFARAPIIRKLFGLGYAGDYIAYPKMIEMDFFELFFSFGYVGFIVLVIPLLYVGSIILIRHLFRPMSWVLLTGLGLTIAISAVAGHVLFAPSVISYIVIATSLLQAKQTHIARM